MSTFLIILMWVGITLGAVLALAVVVFVALLAWSMFTGSTPEGVEVDAAAPVLLAQEEAFTMTVTVRNLLDRERTFRSLDFDDKLLKGFLIERVEPVASETTNGSGSTSYHYTLPIAPRGSLRLTLTCRAINPGEHAGDIMVFVDQKHFKFVTKAHRLVVR